LKGFEARNDDFNRSILGVQGEKSYLTQKIDELKLVI
jgi:hypothetical protein